ncbi:MAG TPA: protein kinase [Candidatus Krumholzibacteria bacterium]|nr:protein kinase [Candidatus Krumholzibacteria bacterium]
MDPKRLGGYELRDVLGEGGMGTVYRAHDPTLDRPAAVKVIRAKALSNEGKERFLREARASSKINHPNIITIYAAGEEDGAPYMAMELIEGKTLREVIDEGGIDWRVSTRWIVQLLDALQRLHAEGIVHRDLKPENVMVTKEGNVKLMDFGLAHLASTTALTQEGTTLGTVPYMSPEQVLGRKLDARSDLFSVATIYHEMLTGQHPFRGEHPMAVMYSIRNETPKPLKLQSSDCPIELQSVLDHAFQKEVDKRYADATAFRNAILEVVPELSGAAPTESRTSPVRMALIIGGISVAVFGFAVSAWNVAQKKTREAARAEAANLNESGGEFELKQDYGSARLKYREAIERDPTYAPPYNNLGVLSEQDGDFEIADDLYRKAVASDPAYAPALLNIGNRFLAQQQKDSAEVYFRRAARGNDVDAGAHQPGALAAANQLGFLLWERGEYHEALAVIDTALAREPAPVVKAYLLKNKGKNVAALGDSTAARVLWAEAAALNPNDDELRSLLAMP